MRRFANQGRAYRYRRMTPEQFSQALDHLGLSVKQFVRSEGAREFRAQQWLAGEEDIPPHVPVMLALMTLPGGLEMAKRVADEFIIQDA